MDKRKQLHRIMKAGILAMSNSSIFASDKGEPCSGVYFHSLQSHPDYRVWANNSSHRNILSVFTARHYGAFNMTR
jgi:hypothetical protein